jgi:hypothetical protein
MSGNVYYVPSFLKVYVSLTLEGNTEEENNGYVVLKENNHGLEPVFVNVYGAQESNPRNRFRQLM